MEEGQLKKRIYAICNPVTKNLTEEQESITFFVCSNVEKHLTKVLDEAKKEYPKVSQKWVPVKGRRVNWKLLCKLMEQKIIEFENFGKKWLGGEKG
jgi:hypothetical protein